VARREIVNPEEEEHQEDPEDLLQRDRTDLCCMAAAVQGDLEEEVQRDPQTTVLNQAVVDRDHKVALVAVVHRDPEMVDQKTEAEVDRH